MLKGKDIRELFFQLTQSLVGFDEFLVQAMFAFVTCNHVLWIGQPGVGKSYAARMIFDLFSGARQMKIQLTKDMLPSALIGNEIPDEYLKSGKEIFNLDGGITQVEFFFGDEFEDASDFLLRMLLTVIHERKFERKDMKVSCPLHSAILTTNFDRMSAAIEAVKDRVIFKAYIPEISGIVKDVQMFNNYMQFSGEMPPLNSIPYAELKAIADLVESPNGIPVPSGVKMITSVLVKKYWITLIDRTKKNQNACQPDRISPRTKNKLMDVLRASAFLNDRSEVAYPDCQALKYAVCILGDDNLDEQVFNDMCSEILPKSEASRKRLDKLAAIAEAIIELQKQPRNLKEIIVRFGKKVETFTNIEFQNLLQALRPECQRTEIEILNEIEDSFKKLSQKPQLITFNWDKDWE